MAFDIPADQTIGIIGGGHLGRALALALTGKGFPRDRILISHKGSRETGKEIECAGLGSCLATNETICRTATIIFITVRPQSAGSLIGLPFRDTCLTVSCMAGVPAGLLEKVLGVPVIRMMPSGPGTLLGYNGIVGIYPSSELLKNFLTALGQEVFMLPDEDQMNVFTAGVCLPSVILTARKLGRDTDSGMQTVIHEFPLITRMYAWAKSAVPQSLTPSESDEYVRRMSTKGGITETIVTSMLAGATLREAFHAGIDRSRAISEESRFSLSEHVITDLLS